MLRYPCSRYIHKYVKTNRLKVRKTYIHAQGRYVCKNIHAQCKYVKISMLKECKGKLTLKLRRPVTYGAQRENVCIFLSGQ
jgi:hypothetical protein